MTKANDQEVFPKKWSKYLPEGFVEKAEGMTVEDLKKKLVECERAINNTEKDLDNDGKLNDAKQEVSNISGAYKEILNAHKAMVKYMVYVLDSRGTP